MSTASSQPGVDPAIVIVATSTTRLPDVKKILAACGITADGGRPAASDERNWEDNNLVFQCEDAQLAVSLMPTAYPWSELEGPCADFLGVARSNQADERRN